MPLILSLCPSRMSLDPSSTVSFIRIYLKTGTRSPLSLLFLGLNKTVLSAFSCTAVLWPSWCLCWIHSSKSKFFFCRARNWMQCPRDSLTSIGQRTIIAPSLLLTFLLIQPRMHLEKASPQGHAADSCLTCGPLGWPRSFLQSCSMPHPVWWYGVLHFLLLNLLRFLSAHFSSLLRSLRIAALHSKVVTILSSLVQ